MGPNKYKLSFRWIAQIITLAFAIGSTSCGSSPSDMRSLVSSDTLIYLESNDLSKTLKLITENKEFVKASASVPDISAIEGIQFAVAITGFNTSENQVTDDRSILNLKPEFVAVAETHLWSWQVRNLVEGALAGFVKRTYGGNVKLEKRSMSSSERYIWTAEDGRKSFAAITGARVYFGNSEEALERSLAAGRGDSESLLSNKALELEYVRSKGKLAFGFISREAIKKIAGVFGVSVAIEKTEDENARGFISRILPQILNNTAEEILWTAEANDEGVTDNVFVKMTPDTSAILNETIVSSNTKSDGIYGFLPPETRQITRYDLKDPRVAFRSVLLVAGKNVSEPDAKLIAAFSNSLLQPYGVTDSENFLSAVGQQLLTAQLDEDGDNSFAVVTIRDLEKIRSAVSGELDLNSGFEQRGAAKLWRSKDGDLAAAEIDNFFILGNVEAVSKAISAWSGRKISPQEAEKDFTKGKIFGILRKSEASSATFGRGDENVGRLVKVFGEVKKNEEPGFSNTLVETRVTRTGIERRYTSAFGFIGTIVSQFESQ
ncbi:MAG: hypothetical protein KDB79_14925 [Acidobacteria bacterium]|nr:hypothetical protein [Acidobacteriota bacterium]